MSGRLTGVYQLPDGSFPPRNSKLWIRVPVDRNDNGVTVYSAPTVVPINPPTHATAPGFYDSGLLPEGPYQIQKAIFGATDYRTRWYSVVLGEGSHTVQELIEDYDPEQYTPPVINQVAVYRDEARTARDEAAQILDDVSAGAVPDSAVASKITAEGSASRAAVDARVAAGTAGLLSEEVAENTYAPVGYALRQLAANPDQLAVGEITRSTSGAATGFSVAWPDGATGVFTGTESAGFPGAIDSYTITHVLGAVTSTYTQPALTRDSSGAVTDRPAIEVS